MDQSVSDMSKSDHYLAILSRFTCRIEIQLFFALVINEHLKTHIVTQVPESFMYFRNILDSAFGSVDKKQKKGCPHNFELHFELSIFVCPAF